MLQFFTNSRNWKWLVVGASLFAALPSVATAQCVCSPGSSGADVTPPTLTGVPASITVSCDNVPSFTGGSSGGGGGNSNCTDPGQFRTQTQGGWGSVCSGGNPGCYRDANFAAAFPNGLTIGCNLTLTLTTTGAVEIFVPCGGPSSVLTQNYLDPTCINNVLAGQLVAATLSVTFDAYDPNFGASNLSLGSLVLNSGPLAGLTVSQVIQEANNAIGGCGSVYSLSDLNSALSTINQNFVDGTMDGGNLSCPGGGGGSSTCGGVTATDQCSVPAIVCNETIIAGNCPGNYTIIRSWTATDACGNTTTASQTVTVVDNTAPVLVGVPANTTAVCGTVPPMATVTATDNCDGNPVVSFVETSNGSACNGSLVRTWTATDNCGNTSSASQVITFEDNTAPVLSGVPANATVSCDNIPAAGQVSASDNCDANPTVTFSQTSNGSGCNYTITRTWTATDACGNSSTASQTLTVVDNTAPVLSGVPSDATVSCDNIPAAGQVSATDNCDANPTVTLTQTSNGSGCNYTITRTWTATDACGNSSTASQTLTVVDNTAPVLSGVPSDATVSCDNIPAAGQVSATDNCDANPTVTFSQSTSGSGCNYTITRTWTATDACGNSSTASQTLTVVDNTAPVAICQNVTVQAGSGGTVTVTASLVDNGSNDNCTASQNLTLSLSQSTFNCTNGGGQVTLTVTDACGNSSSCSATVTVESGCSVAFETCPSNIVRNCTNNCYNNSNGAMVSWTAPTASAFSACSVNTCPTSTYICGYTYLGEYNGHRYYLSSGCGVSWTQARNAANNDGGSLVSINDAGENTFLTNALGSMDVWMGYNDAQVEGTWRWTNGDNSNYTNWYPGEPNNQTPNSNCCTGGADYGVFNGGNGKWYDRGCIYYNYVMEIECSSNSCPVTITQVSGPASGSFFSGGSTTTITYVATTSGGASDTCSFTVTVNDCPLNYCSSYAQCSGYEYIRQVAVSNLNNWSYSNGGYGNFTQYSASVTAGSCYNMTLRPGFSGNSYNESWSVYVDWNRDGDFTDQGEYMYAGTSYSTINTLFCVPNNAIAGSTRMRVVMRYGCGYPGPCGGYSYGETEDYTITVMPSSKTMPSENGQPEVTQPEAPISTAAALDGLEMMELYPNPVTTLLNVKFTSLREGNATVEVFTIDGKSLYREGASVQQRDNQVSIPVGNLAVGTYLVRISIGDQYFSEKFVKE